MSHLHPNQPAQPAQPFARAEALQRARAEFRPRGPWLAQPLEAEGAAA